MEKPFRVSLDEQAAAALAKLEELGYTRAEAINQALVAMAARVATWAIVSAEVAALEQDPSDRREMKRVARLMAALRT